MKKGPSKSLFVASVFQVIWGKFYFELRTWKPEVDERVLFLKMWYIPTVEYYSFFKKKEILPFASMWMNLEDIMLHEISQTQKDKY